MTGERRQVREGVIAEVVDATDVAKDNVRIENPEALEELPAIAYTFTVRDVPMNINTAPSEKRVDESGAVVGYVYTNVKDMVFSFTSVSESEVTREGIYNDLNTRFSEFSRPIRDVGSIHDSVVSVFVNDVSPYSDTNRNPRTRGDDMTYTVRFTETVERDVTAIESIDGDVDGDEFTVQ